MNENPYNVALRAEVNPAGEILVKNNNGATVWVYAGSGMSSAADSRTASALCELILSLS